MQCNHVTIFQTPSLIYMQLQLYVYRSSCSFPDAWTRHVFTCTSLKTAPADIWLKNRSVLQKAVSSNRPLNCNAVECGPTAVQLLGWNEVKSDTLTVWLFFFFLSIPASLCWCSDNTIRWGPFCVVYVNVLPAVEQWGTACVWCTHALSYHMCFSCISSIFWWHFFPVWPRALESFCTSFPVIMLSLYIFMPDDNSYRTVDVPSVLTADLLSLPCRWMKKPRCGVPDQIGGAAKFSVRKRRYALTGQKWQHKHITYRWVVHQLDTEQWHVLI